MEKTWFMSQRSVNVCLDSPARNLLGRFQPSSHCLLTTVTSPDEGPQAGRPFLCHYSQPPTLHGRKPWQLLYVTQQNSSHTTALGSCLASLPCLGSSPSPDFSLRVLSLQPGFDHPACSLSGTCGSSSCLWRVRECSFVTNFLTRRGQCLLINFRCFSLRKNSQVGR